MPTVDGVAPSRQTLPAGRWRTVLEFLSERHASVGAEVWAARMREGRVVDEAGRRVTPETPYREGARVYYYREPGAEARVPFGEEVVHLDEHILVADKPHFLAVAPAGRFLRETLLVRLKMRTKLDALVPVHRIDRETAGLVVFSVNPRTRGAYASLFERREVSKVYEALSRSRPALDFPHTRRSRLVAGEPFFRMKEVEGEPDAETRVDVLAAGEGATLYEARPLTGRKHQVRVHLAALGAPIVNDRLYPDILNNDAPEDYSAPLKLLARALAFRDPLTGRERYFESARKL
ncbi:MAG: pseudouridine synthase [Acidobacteriota bacterium]|nr:pseudouridine synthase [Acidobacteriota bacterium]